MMPNAINPNTINNRRRSLIVLISVQNTNIGRFFTFGFKGITFKPGPKSACEVAMPAEDRYSHRETGGQCAEIDRVHFVSWVRCVAFTQ